MTLKEKIFTVFYETASADLIEKIADEYAKEVLRTYISSRALQYKQSQGDYSLDELLSIIKKEKGL
jgi:hypothetical protein